MIGRDISWSQKYKWELLIAMSIALIPFLIYTHLLFDKTDNGLIEFFGLTYVHGYPNATTFIWFVLSTLIPFVLLVVWFLVNSYWWRYFVIIPGATYLYRFFNECLYYPDFIEASRELYSLLFTLLFTIVLLVFDKYLFSHFRIKKINHTKVSTTNVKALYYQIIDQLSIIQEKDYNHKDGLPERLLLLQNRLNEYYTNSIAQNSKKYFRYMHKREIVIILALICIPLIYFSYKLVSAEQMNIEFFGISIGSHGFLNFRAYAWFLLHKICIIIPMIIWFHTSKNWWRYAILSPVILYIYQVWEANQDVRYLDSYGNLKAFPAIFLVILLIVILSNIFKYRYGLLDMYEEIEDELERMIDKTAKEGIEEINILQNLTKERRKSDNTDKKDQGYLEDLNALRERIKFQLKAIS